MRETAIEDLHHSLTTLARRARDMSGLHPGPSLVACTVLTEIDLAPGVRAAGLCAHFGLDKSRFPGNSRTPPAGLSLRELDETTLQLPWMRWQGLSAWADSPWRMPCEELAMPAARIMTRSSARPAAVNEEDYRRVATIRELAAVPRAADPYIR
jgi:hypothetical protein